MMDRTKWTTRKAARLAFATMFMPVAAAAALSFMASCSDTAGRGSGEPAPVASAQPAAAATTAAPDCTLRPDDGDKAQIDQLIACFQYAYETGNEKQLIQYFSPDYTSYDGANFEWLRDHLNELLAVKRVLNPTLNMETVTIAIQGDRALVGPFFVNLPTGKLMFSVELKKYETIGWKVLHSIWKA